MHLIISLNAFINNLKKQNIKVYIYLIGKKGKNFIKCYFKDQYLK